MYNVHRLFYATGFFKVGGGMLRLLQKDSTSRKFLSMELISRGIGR